MRTTDPDPTPFRPLGERVVKEKPAAPAPKPEGKSGLVTDADGKMRTTSHKPYSALTLEEAIANWREIYADEHRIDFLP